MQWGGQDDARREDTQARRCERLVQKIFPKGAWSCMRKNCRLRKYFFQLVKFYLKMLSMGRSKPLTWEDWGWPPFVMRPQPPCVPLRILLLPRAFMRGGDVSKSWLVRRHKTRFGDIENETKVRDIISLHKEHRLPQANSADRILSKILIRRHEMDEPAKLRLFGISNGLLLRYTVIKDLWTYSFLWRVWFRLDQGVGACQQTCAPHLCAK